MNRKKYEDGIQYIADAYGLGNQREKLIEELSELLVAVTHGDRENIAEEMADVRIMIDQVAYLMDIRPVVEGYVKSKIDRTLCEMEGWWRMSQVVARLLQHGGGRMTKEMEKAMEDLARALDRLCDVVEGSDGAQRMLALDVRELMNATSLRGRYCVIGNIAGMVHELWKYDYITERAGEAMAALYRVREMGKKEEEE